MDKRQEKTINAIFDAFISLITEKNYNKITIQEIIQKAQIGRSTFYSHFETKDDLLAVLCNDIFHHILDAATDCRHTHGYIQHDGMPNSLIYHMLQHIKENDHNILVLLSCNGNEFFLSSFKEHLGKLMKLNFVLDKPKMKQPLPNLTQMPEDFILNHITGSFVEMLQWWIKNGLKESPEELDAWFTQVITQGC